MKRVALHAVSLALCLAVTACGNKAFQSLCDNQVPPPPGCGTPCDPTPGATNSCPAGYHCSADGKCDAQCTPTGGQCGDGYSCSSDGFCQSGPGSTGSNEPDANCPAIHFAPTRTIPTVELLLDQSLSMNDPYGATTRWQAMRSALIDPTNGVVKKLESQVVFGMTLYSAVSNNNTNVPPCPRLTTQARALNNFSAISGVLSAANPIQDTPTAPSIDAVRASFAAKPPAQGSPPIIVLATDGLPDTCEVPNPANGTQQGAANTVTETAAQAAYAAGIKLFFLFVGTATTQVTTHAQRMANAGAGKDLATGTAPYYVATDPAALVAAFNQIIGGVVSCDLKLTGGTVDPAGAASGSVTVNGGALVYGTEWTLDPDGVTIHILGAACTALKASANPVVDAAFACGSVIY